MHHAEGDSRPSHFAGAIGPAAEHCCITDFTFASSGLLEEISHLFSRYRSSGSAVIALIILGNCGRSMSFERLAQSHLGFLGNAF